MLYVKEIKSSHIVEVNGEANIFSIEAEHVAMEEVNVPGVQVAFLAKLLESSSNNVLTLCYSDFHLLPYIVVRTHGDELLFFPQSCGPDGRCTVVEWITSRYPSAILREDIAEGINHFCQAVENGYDILFDSTSDDQIRSIIAYADRINYHRDNTVYFRNREDTIGRHFGDTVRSMSNIIYRLNNTTGLNMRDVAKGLDDIVDMLTSEPVKNMEEFNRDYADRKEVHMDNEFLNDLLSLSVSALALAHTVGFDVDTCLRSYMQAKHCTPIKLDRYGLVDDPVFELLD